MIRCRGKGADVLELNAQEIAGMLCKRASPSDANAKFEIEIGTWFYLGLLVIARPGKGEKNVR